MTPRRLHPLEAPLRAAIEHYVGYVGRRSTTITLSARLAADLMGGTATPQLLGRAAPAVVRALTAEGWRITYDDHKGRKLFVITRVP
jgi:hypothetical protein